MTTSDAPQPPGGPLRQDGAEGDLAPDEHRADSAEPAGADGSDQQRTRPGDDEPADDSSTPAVHGDRPEQGDSAAEQQAENAETSLDQPSS